MEWRIKAIIVLGVLISAIFLGMTIYGALRWIILR